MVQRSATVKGSARNPDRGGEPHRVEHHKNKPTTGIGGLNIGPRFTEPPFKLSGDSAPPTFCTSNSRFEDGLSSNCRGSEMERILRRLLLEQNYATSTPKPKMKKSETFEKDSKKESTKEPIPKSQMDKRLGTTDHIQPAGLKNFGNTCYMNSILQSLYNIPNFRDKIISCIPFISATENMDSAFSSNVFVALAAIFLDMKSSSQLEHAINDHLKRPVNNGLVRNNPGVQIISPHLYTEMGSCVRKARKSVRFEDELSVMSREKTILWKLSQMDQELVEYSRLVSLMLSDKNVCPAEKPMHIMSGRGECYSLKCKCQECIRFNDLEDESKQVNPSLLPTLDNELGGRQNLDRVGIERLIRLAMNKNTPKSLREDLLSIIGQIDASDRKEKNTVEPIALITAITGDPSVLFNPKEQQDCHEFLRYLLCRVKDALSESVLQLEERTDPNKIENEKKSTEKTELRRNNFCASDPRNNFCNSDPRKDIDPNIGFNRNVIDSRDHEEVRPFSWAESVNPSQDLWGKTDSISEVGPEPMSTSLRPRLGSVFPSDPIIIGWKSVPGLIVKKKANGESEVIFKSICESRSNPTYGKTVENAVIEPIDWVWKTFGGIGVTITRCHACNEKVERKEPFLDLSLPVEHGRTLRWALRTLSTLELLTGENKYYCANCEQMRDADMWWEIQTLPDVLVLHLKIFDFLGVDFGGGTKIRSVLDCPMKLSPHRWCSADFERRKSLYRLMAVIVHDGLRLSSGHFFSYVFVWDLRQWYCFNDALVTPVKEGRMTCLLSSRESTQTPYMLFYAIDSEYHS